MKFSTLWNIVSGKPYPFQRPDGQIVEFTNYWQFLKYRRGKSFSIQMSEDRPQPDVATLRQNVEDNPTDFQARLHLGAHLATFGSPDEGYKEFLEAIALLSSDQGGETGARRLSDRSFANYMAARTLDEMGRDAAARQHWKRCAEDMEAAFPDKKSLRDNPLYVRAMDRLK